MESGMRSDAGRRGALGKRIFRVALVVAAVAAVWSQTGGCGRYYAWRHGGDMRRAYASAEELRAHLTRHADRALDRVDATPEQRAKIHAVVDRLAPDAFRFHQERTQLRERFLKAMDAEKVDPEEIEKTRKDASDLVERASKRMTEALTEAASTLSPEQRRKLLARWKECR